MRPLSRKRRGLSLRRVYLVFQVAAGLGIIAVVVGRSVPERALDSAPRTPAHPRYIALDGYGVQVPGRGAPAAFDTESGAWAPCRIPGAKDIFGLACSPWRDGEGRYHVLSQGMDRAGETNVLVRYTIPAGGGSGLFRMDGFVAGRICWFPDRPDRILLVAADRQLYVFDLRTSSDGADPAPAVPRPVEWRTPPPGVGPVWHHAPGWPSIPALRGRLLVSLCYQDDHSSSTETERLWWLTLNPDAGAIVAAEPAIVPAADDPSGAPLAERLSSVGVTSDGTLLLAYLGPARGDRNNLEVWVVPIDPPASGHGPRALAAAARRLARGCSPALLAFSADARWVYAARTEGARYRVVRLALDGPRDTATAVADRTVSRGAMTEHLE
jgi:hypothetical protein